MSQKMTDRVIISYLIFKMNMEKRALEKRWGLDMPDIPKEEYGKIVESIAWLQKKMNGLLEDEYDYKAEDIP